MISRRTALAGAAAGVPLLLANAPAATAAPSLNQNWSKLHMLFLIWSFESNPFFAPMINGVKEAEKATGIRVEIAYGNEDLTRMNNILQTAMANGTNGLGVTIPNDDALNATLDKAKAKKIPVISFNIDNSKGAAGKTYRLAFVGQSFVNAGITLGERMIAVHHLGKGDLVFTPVEAPAAVYAVQRHAGVAQALAKVGARTEILGTGNDHAKALSLMTQFLLGHSNTKAVISLGQTPNSQAVRAIKAAGLKIPAGGFDISPSILKDILDGSLTAAVDQQPYTQGYYTVAQMADNLRYGLYPSDMQTGGSGLIDKTNAAAAVKWAGVTR
ncbi:MAG: substrate-binding domain-containing protein [Acetobacteraceae bacterium]